jgi:hypothetical protein
MTRAQYVALLTGIGALGAGAALTFNIINGQVDQTILDPSKWNQISAGSCSSHGVCSSTVCAQAQDVAADAGFPLCVPILVDCDWKVTPLMRSCAADAGIALGPQLYQRLELVDLRCPAVDGGFAFGGPFDDAGCPYFAAGIQQVTPLCARAPLDGGLMCLRNGTFFGTGNVFPASQATGSNCDAVSCAVFAGDDPNTSL